MTSKAKPVQDTRSESERWMQGQEHDRGWRCINQVKANNDRTLIEIFLYPKAETILVVVKDYDGQIRLGKPWPKMRGCQVYVPLDTTNTWDSLEKAFDALEAKTSAPSS